jgi:hypothetical protein
MALYLIDKLNVRYEIQVPIGTFIKRLLSSFIKTFKGLLIFGNMYFYIKRSTGVPKQLLMK